MKTLTVPARFCGPPDTANGGYLAGRFASYVPQLVSIRLHAPIPLDAELALVDADNGVLELKQGEKLLAAAAPATLDLAVPTPPDYLDALESSRRFIAFGRHFFPRCFVCGTDRARGDGLRIFAGANRDGTLVAAPWVPDESLDLGDGKVAGEYMWAALDCPGYFAARDDGVPMLLGEFTAHVDRRVHVDEPCVVIGWRIAIDGRKYVVGTALFDEDGELCGRARATWIAPRAQLASVAD